MKTKRTHIGMAIFAIITLVGFSFAADTIKSNYILKRFIGSFPEWLTCRPSLQIHEILGKERLDFIVGVSAMPSPKLPGMPFQFERQTDLLEEGKHVCLQYSDHDVQPQAHESLASFDRERHINLTWNQYIAAQLAEFWRVAEDPDNVHLPDKQTHKDVLVVWGIIGSPGNMKWSDTYGLSSEWLQDRLWNSMQTNMSLWWSMTKPQDRHVLRAVVLPEIEAYLASFDLEKERVHLHSLRQNNHGRQKFKIGDEFPDELEFVKIRPDGTTRANGKLEAFCFRRIAAGDFTLDRMRELCVRFKTAITDWDSENSISATADAQSYSKLADVAAN